jgi:hypothetical protein
MKILFILLVWGFIFPQYSYAWTALTPPGFYSNCDIYSKDYSIWFFIINEPWIYRKILKLEEDLNGYSYEQLSLVYEKIKELRKDSFNERNIYMFEHPEILSPNEEFDSYTIKWWKCDHQFNWFEAYIDEKKYALYVSLEDLVVDIISWKFWVQEGNFATISYVLVDEKNQKNKEWESLRFRVWDSWNHSWFYPYGANRLISPWIIWMKIWEERRISFDRNDLYSKDSNNILLDELVWNWEWIIQEFTYIIKLTEIDYQ